MFKLFLINLIYSKFLILFFINIVCSKNTSIKCGDGKCYGEGIETCFNCEVDCGKCNFPTFKKCLKPGQFALTFDDGPTEYTNELLDILKEHEVKATFFVLGIQAAKPELASVLLRAFKEGHSIGSHSYNHPRFTEIDDQKVIDEVKKAGDQIEKIIGKRPILFRFPYLATDLRTGAILNSLGYINVDITADSFDWREKIQNPGQIIKNICQVVERTDPIKDSLISLQHDTTNPKSFKLNDMINFIRSKKFKFVTMETCLGLNTIYQTITEFDENIKNNNILSEIRNNNTKIKKDLKEDIDMPYKSFKINNGSSEITSKSEILYPFFGLFYFILSIFISFF